jgi:hypothetical protein
MSASAVERYLRLGLQLGRHVEGIVDAYYGPPELAAAVAAEPPAEPRTLVAEAETLLDELDDGWLRDQVVGVRTYAGVLAGESDSYADEVEGCYGVRPTHTDEAVFAAAHERLEELLPGEGPLAERHERWEDSIRVPAEQVERLIAAVIEEARAWTGRLIELPQGEGVALEIVRGKSWWAFCEYLGALRSRVAVNVDPAAAGHRPAHPRDPRDVSRSPRGASQQGARARWRSWAARGDAGAGAHAAVARFGGDRSARAGAAAREPGRVGTRRRHARRRFELDLAHAVAVRRTLLPCRWAEVNAALMLHEEGRSEAETQAYLERWGLMTPKLAAHLIRFLTATTSRSYILTYPAGRELCGSFVRDDLERFRRLLTEQLRVRDLLDT